MAETTITFRALADTGGSLVIEPDYEAGGNKSVYGVGEQAYLRVYPSCADLSVSAVGSSWRIAVRNVRESRSEYLSFRDASSAKLEYPPVSVTKLEWISAGAPVPAVRGSQASVGEEVFNVLYAEYETSYDLIEFTGLVPCYALVKAESSQGAVYAEIDYTDTETDISERPVIITARDAATREIIDGADVYINGALKGTTDSSGMLNLGRLKKGLYSLRVHKEGYLDTDSDYLKNDSFTVE